MKLTLDILKTAFDKSPDEALEYFKSLGIIDEDDAKWDDYFEKFNQDAFTIAKINNAQHLTDAKDLITEAIKSGENLKLFKETLRDKLDLRGWHADLVVTQNISNAYNAGRYYQQIDDPDDDFPYIRPYVMNDKKTTDQCKWLAGKNIVLKINDPLLNEMYTPRHFRCRTIYSAISEAQRKRWGLSVVDIKDIPTKYRNHKDFRQLPSEPYSPDLSKFDKELREKIK
ncbi:MAG: minor capsid protein [Candidatus Kapabacteria bacterium]|nr:minor capsid protein [Ignavibacteriota bacterium]MCW5886387.1 minor capsid protein [Candidatus Kapabacteria bacterium]